MTFDKPDIAVELARLKRVQRGERVFLAVTFLLLVGLFGFVLLGRAKSAAGTLPLISAEQFRLVATDGDNLAMLSKARQGPLLELVQNKAKVELALRQGGPEFSMMDGNGNSRAAIAATRDKKTGREGTTLVLLDEEGKTRASITVGKIGSELSLLDSKGKARIKISVRDDVPRLEFFDAEGKVMSGKP